MKYTGRWGITLFILLSGLGMWGLGKESFQYYDVLAPIILVVSGWKLGKKYDKAKQQAEKDQLTNVYNRRFVQMIAPKLLALSKRHNETLGVSVVDVDNFKMINDTFGHEVGDKVLQDITNALTNATRESDVVARWGGDELLILSPAMENKCPKVIIQRVENELKEISRQMDMDITVSIGTALYPDDGCCLAELIEEADKNMYEFKFSKKKSNNPANPFGLKHETIAEGGH